MLRKLGLITMSCVVLAACTPRHEDKGRVVVGLDGDGALVAVLGVCDKGWTVTVSVHAVTEPSTTSEVEDFIGHAELDSDSTVGTRIALRPDEAPDGWTAERWSLPEQGIIRVSAHARKDFGLAVVQTPDHADVDLAAVPPLPENAEEESTKDC